MNTRPLDIKLDEIEFVKATPFEQSFRVRINIKNKGSEALFLRELTYKVMLNNIEVSSGDEPVWQNIPAFSTRQIDLVISTNLWDQLKPIFSSIKDLGEVNYYFTGELIMGNLFLQQMAPVKHAGVLTRDQLPIKKIRKLEKLIPNLSYLPATDKALILAER